MKFQVGQVVEIKLKDGRRAKGEVGSLDQYGMTLWNAEVVNTDGTTSNARILAVAFQDIVEEPHEEAAAPIEEKKAEAAEAPVAPAEAAEKPRRRKKPARK